MSILEPDYRKLCVHADSDLKGDSVSQSLCALIKKSIRFVADNCIRVPALSRVPHKSYECLRAKSGSDRLSRPIRSDLFDAEATMDCLADICGADLTGVNPNVRERLLYTAAMAYCCATDILKKDDKKTPGTFFEIFVAHLVAKTYGVNPKKSIETLNLDVVKSGGSLPSKP